MPRAGSNIHRVMVGCFIVEALILALCVVAGIRHDGIWRPAAPVKAESSESVNPKVSCQFRGTCPPPGAIWI